MKRKLVLFFTIALMVIGLLAAPSQPQVQGQDRCQYVRNECYANWNAYRRFCIELTGDYNRCNQDFNDGYRACAGDCW